MNCKFKFYLRAALPRGAARPAGLRLRAGLPAVPMRRCRTWWALPGRLGSANGRDAFYCFARPTGSRSKTEFFGIAGRRARTAPAGGLLFPDFQVHGSRSKTEFFGFAGRRARTAPAGGLRSDEKRCTEGPGVRASLPTIIFSKGKN